MSTLLDEMRGGLLVSCQPVTGGPLDHPSIVAAFAQAALNGGAIGLRIEGLANLAAVRSKTRVPIIGLIKSDLEDSPVRITPKIEHIRALVDKGADVVAVDATDRERPVAITELVAAIKSAGALAMADCATKEEGRHAADLGFDILASTMSGYAVGPETDGPDLNLVRELAKTGKFVVAEGRYHTPAQAAAAMGAGASAVVAGSAITRPEHVTSWFASAIKDARGAV